jgi:hypothetical protein
MASGAEHDVDLVERDRLLEELNDQIGAKDRSPWYVVQTRPHGPGETTEVLLNITLVESITNVGSDRGRYVSWGTLRRR